MFSIVQFFNLDCPIRFNVFHNWENFIINEKTNDVRLGDLAKFTMKLNDEEKSSLKVSTSSNYPNFIFEILVIQQEKNEQ